MASGDTLARFAPHSQHLGLITNRAPQLNILGQPALMFAPDQDTEALFADVMPSTYGATTGETVRIIVVCPDAVAGNVVFGASLERRRDNSTDSILAANTQFDTEVTATAAVPATAGLLKYIDIALPKAAGGDSIAARESYRLRIRRLGKTSALDTVDSANVYVIGVEMKET